MDTDRLLRELMDFLRIPSVSTLPAHDVECRAAAEWVAGELRRLRCREVRLLASDTHPVVWGVGPEVPGAPTRLLAKLKSPDGRINIPALYAAVRRPTRAELASWKRLPFKEREFLRHRVQAKALTGLKKYSVLERLWALPTFEIHGITGGFTGDGAKTVIPAEATAKVSLRLVPDQKLKVVERQLAAAVRRLAPKHIQASVKFLHGADPATVKVTHP